MKQRGNFYSAHKEPRGKVSFHNLRFHFSEGLQGRKNITHIHTKIKFTGTL